MFFEVPAKTCEATAGGVPVSAKEVDAILPYILYPGKYIVATDGAGAYQSLAPPARAANHKTGTKVSSFNKDRFVTFYKSLDLSRGIVSHSAEQWAVVDKVRVVTGRGATKIVEFKKGTQVVDGLWPELRSSIPDSVNTNDWERCNT